MESLDVFIRAYGYPALFGAMFVEQFVPPMPGEPLLIGAGALAGTGRFSLSLAAVLAFAGTVVAAVLAQSEPTCERGSPVVSTAGGRVRR